MDIFMKTTKVVPSLSTDGWVDDPIKKADYIFSHFFLSDFSQTYNYLGSVSSLAYIIQESQGNAADAVGKTRDTLEGYFSRYFDDVVVEVRDETTASNPSDIVLSIYVSFSQNGTPYSLGKNITTTNSIIKKVIDISNGA